MGGSLSQEEIDALLRGAAGGESSDAEASDTPAVTADENHNSASDGGAPQADIPNEMERGLLGEIYNISMGAAAKAVATLVKMKVDITTPTVKILKRDELVFKTLEPAVGVKINYIEGIQGENIFILSQVDIMKLVDIIVGGSGNIDENSEFTEMHMSAVGEIMNQMMGASSMNVAQFLNLKIDISVPETFKIDGDFSLQVEPTTDDWIVATEFKFIVGDIINSEMITTCSLAFAKDLIRKAMENFGMSFDETPAVVETTAVETPPAVQEPEPQASLPESEHVPEPKKAEPVPVQSDIQPQIQTQQNIQPPQTQYNAPGQEELRPHEPQQPPVAQQQQYQPQQTQQYLQQTTPVMFDPQQMYSMFAQQQQMLLQLTEKLTAVQNQPQPQQQSAHPTSQMAAVNLNAQPANFLNFDSSAEANAPFENIDLVMDLSLDVSVEIGKARKAVSEVLELGEGAIIELDKQAADPVDIYVNGNLIARGTVIVMEENFAVRITEIVSPQDKLKAARNKK